MISFENFHSVEGVPIYLQMIRHVKQGLRRALCRMGTSCRPGGSSPQCWR